MAKSIIDYQNAYKEITELLKKNNNTLLIISVANPITVDISPIIVTTSEMPAIISSPQIDISSLNW